MYNVLNLAARGINDTSARASFRHYAVRKKFYRTDKGKLVAAIPADGQEGYVLRSGLGWQWYFRVYSPNGNFDFVDFKLIHPDLCICIEDRSAVFYENYYDERRLDYSHVTIHTKPQDGTSADDQEGHLIRYGRNRQYHFRLYQPNEKCDFVDYWLTHCDLFIRIMDTSAAFFSDHDGNRWLGHSPEILDYKLEKQFSYSRA